MTTHNDLFEKYLDICNQAMKKNKDTFPFKQILGAAKQSQDNQNIEVCIIDNDPAASYVMTIDGDTINAQSHDECKHCDCSGKWRVNKTYLKDVINNPDAYIRNPAKLDWDWMNQSTVQ